MATRSPLPASTCRSTQLYATLSSPSLNHLANGGFDPSRVWVGSLAQLSRRACSAQKPSLSALACSYASAVTLAFAARSAGGANLRSSLSRLARLSLVTASAFPGVSVVSQATAHQTRGSDDKSRPVIGLDLCLSGLRAWSPWPESMVPTDAGRPEFRWGRRSCAGVAG